MNTTLNIDAQGVFTVSYVINGKTIPFLTSKNTVINTGYDILAKALAGEENSGINCLYMAYTNDALPTYPSLSASFDADTYFKTTLLNDANAGLIKVPVLASGFAASEAAFQNNIISFYGVGGDTSFYGPEINTSSKLFTVALVNSPDLESLTDDSVFSVAVPKDSGDSDIYITKLANAQFGVSWSISLLRSA